MCRLGWILVGVVLIGCADRKAQAAPDNTPGQAPGEPLAVVEFSDFQCPHCKRLQPILERLLDDYRGQVKLYFKNYPIARVHPYAEIAAQAALAAGRQGKFWAFHDRLFSGDQEKEAPSDL